MQSLNRKQGEHHPNTGRGKVCKIPSGRIQGTDILPVRLRTGNCFPQWLKRSECRHRRNKWIEKKERGNNR